MKSFHSKILLFGEYSIIRGASALCTPYSAFEGSLKFSNNEPVVVNTELKSLGQYLLSLATKEELCFDFDIARFALDVEKGLIFDSTIPQGYGIGSSGALCAAIFDEYSKESRDKSISEFKKIFSKMESHFHGSSSGIDPLISFLDRPLFLKSKDDIEIVNIPKFSEGKGGIFLLNTGRTRRTEPLVNHFLEKCKDKTFSTLCDQVLTPINNNCILSLLKGDTNSLYEFFRELSDFQYRHFSPMIPKLFLDIWRDGIKTECFYLKLCGAGGGGFFLGITKDFKLSSQALAGHQIQPLYFF